MSQKQGTERNLDESNDELIRVNIPMNPNLKSEWVKFAKSRNQSLAGMVRDAVKELMKRELPNTAPQSDILQKLNKLEEQYSQKSKEQSDLLNTLLQTRKSDLEDTEKVEIKGKILEVLEDNPKGLHYKDLAQKCRIKEETLLKLVGELQHSEIIEFKATRVKLVR